MRVLKKNEILVHIRLEQDLATFFWGPRRKARVKRKTNIAWEGKFSNITETIDSSAAWSATVTGPVDAENSPKIRPLLLGTKSTGNELPTSCAPSKVKNYIKWKCSRRDTHTHWCKRKCPILLYINNECLDMKFPGKNLCHVISTLPTGEAFYIVWENMSYLFSCFSFFSNEYLLKRESMPRARRIENKKFKNLKKKIIKCHPFSLIFNGVY